MTKTDNEYTDILAMVTHDLKSPLTAIIGSLDYLELDDLSTDEKKHAVKTGKKASKSLLKLIDNILVMAKLEAGKEQIQLEPVKDMKEHFKNIISTFKYEAKIKNINIQLRVSKTLPKKVYWDIEKLHYHVFNNIISNSMKFIPELTGKIKIDIKSLNKKEVIVTIKDNGTGIPKSKRDSIFEKFDTHNNQKIFKGTGLGLYNAYLFVSQHNGIINVIDGINKQGVGFEIILPINPSHLNRKC